MEHTLFPHVSSFKGAPKIYIDDYESNYNQAPIFCSLQSRLFGCTFLRANDAV